MVTSPDWRTQATAIKAQTLSKIPRDSLISAEDLPARVVDIHLTGPYLRPLEQEIVQLDACDLRDRLAVGVYTAVEVIGAYIRSASLAHQATNCLTDLFPEEALDRARWLDEQYQLKGGPVGPLHGLPISVKVCLFSLSAGQAFLSEPHDRTRSTLRVKTRPLDFSVKVRRSRWRIVFSNPHLSPFSPPQPQSARISLQRTPM